MKRFHLGVCFLLLLAFVGAIMLLDFTDNAPEAMLKKTVYTLYSDTGTSYYEAPGGKEVDVLYLEEPTAPEDMPEKKAGERWLGYGEVKVEQPVAGWAKVDIGDGGVPLYVQEENLYVQEVPMFEGRKAEDAFMSTGLSNVPPVWMMRIMSCALYFLLLMPCYILFRHFFRNDSAYASENARKTGIQFRLMAFAALVYFVLLLTAQYLCGFNLDNNWFVRANYLGSSLLAVFNIAVGLVGAAALGYSLLLFLGYCCTGVKGFRQFLLKVGFSGVFLLVAGVYFVLIFLGVLVGVLVVGFFAIAVWKAISTPSGGPDPFRCCRHCQYSNGSKTTCSRGCYVEDVDRSVCDEFEPNAR